MVYGGITFAFKKKTLWFFMERLFLQHIVLYLQRVEILFLAKIFLAIMDAELLHVRALFLEMMLCLEETVL